MCRFAVSRSNNSGFQTAQASLPGSYANVPTPNPPAWNPTSEDNLLLNLSATAPNTVFQTYQQPGAAKCNVFADLPLDLCEDLGPIDFLELLKNDEHFMSVGAQPEMYLDVSQFSNPSSESKNTEHLDLAIHSSSILPVRHPQVSAPLMVASQDASMASQFQLGMNCDLTAEMLEAIQAETGQKATKAYGDLSEAIERIKKKRRESAQRSRAKKSAYIKTLELENEMLRKEVIKLRSLLARSASVDECVGENCNFLLDQWQKPGLQHEIANSKNYGFC